MYIQTHKHIHIIYIYTLLVIKKQLIFPKKSLYSRRNIITRDVIYICINQI